MVEFNLKGDLLNRSKIFRVQLDNYLRQAIKKYNSSEKYIDTLESQELLTKFKEIASSNKRFKQNELYGLNKGDEFIFSDLLVESLALEQINHKNENEGKLINFHSTQVVLVAMEDSGYGFLFMKYILRRLYQDYRVIVIQTMGNQNFEKQIEFIDEKLKDLGIQKINAQVFIYDNIDIVTKIQGRQAIYKYSALKRYMTSMQEHTSEVHPIQFEELMIQVRNLPKLTGKLSLEDDQLFSMYQKLIDGASTAIDIVKMQMLIEDGSTAENMLENYVSNLLYSTGYDVSHRDSTLGWCWYKKCSDCGKIKYCKNDSNLVKIKEYTNLQLIYLVIKSLDEGLGLRYRSNSVLDSQLQDKNSYLYDILRE